jgi:hypothetical protein
MKRIGLLSLIFAISHFASDLPDALRQAALGWTEAVVKQDKAALERLLADDLSFVHSNGTTIQTKAEYISAVTKGAPGYESLSLSDMSARVYGKTAVLSAFIDTKHVGRDPFRVRTLQVFVETNGQWQLAALLVRRVNKSF